MKRPYKYWTTAETARFVRLYPHAPNTELAKIFGRSAPSMAQKAIKLGIVKSDAFMAKHSGRFGKYNDSWNKGKPYSPAGVEKTHFKPGQLPHNTKPLGTEKTDKDGITWRKIAETRVKHADWARVKDLVFIEHYGPIPEGKFVIHANRDKSDFRPENLIAVSCSEHIRRINPIRKKPKPALAIYLEVASALMSSHE